MYFHGGNCGDIRDYVEGVICLGSAKGGDSIGYGVDDGGGSGVEMLTSHIDIDEEYTLGSSVGSFDGITYGKPCGFTAGKYLE